MSTASVPTARIGTRTSNAEKHPGIPDQKSKRRSPAEMATVRAAEKAIKDKKVTAEFNAPFVVARLEDSMADADRVEDANAARPIPVEIARAIRPLRRSHAIDRAALVRHEEIEDEERVDGG